MTFTDWLAEQAAMRKDDVADFAQGPACDPDWPVQAKQLEDYEDFVMREYGAGAVKTLHRAWNEFQKSKAPKGQESPFGGSIVGSVARAKANKRSRTRKSDPPAEPVSNGYQHTNFWQGHPTLDKANLPMKPPGR
jgi:hypothetical protein